MRSILIASLVAGWLIGTPALWAQGRADPLVEKVRRGIERGISYLKQSQNNAGAWSVNFPGPAVDYQGGGTALAVLALLESGVPVDDPAVKRGLQNLRGRDERRTYVVALQTMALVKAGQPEQDAERIRANVKWLLDARVYGAENKNRVLMGWSYELRSPGGTTDNSNSQYALLGLWAGKQAGVDIDAATWKEIQDFYIRTQSDDGGWVYGGGDRARPTLTMTNAGLCGLLISGMEMNASRETLQADGSATNCGIYRENLAVQKSLNWISNRLRFEMPGRTFYNIYGIERVGRLTGERFIGEYDWYRQGCEYLVNIQREDGSWKHDGNWDGVPAISTSFALLFLSKGRTPILISKLVHGSFPRNPLDTDWNNDRNDLRHFVDYASTELFHRLPLAWQNFDMMKGANDRARAKTLTDEHLSEVTSDLLQSPIVYITGHQSPQFRFTAVEKTLLKRYIDSGGFILAEACCNRPEFDAGFKRLCEELWPDSPLEYLDGNHPVWSAHAVVTPGAPYKLMGINMGCKTVLVYSPQDFSCQWENNLRKTGRGEQAFRLGANIVAYATGLEPPRPRLSSTEVVSDKDVQGEIPRGFLKVAQVRHGGDWHPAPRAMRNLMKHLNTEYAIDVALKTQELRAGARSIVDYKFVYMHGRGEFSFTDKQLEFLRFNLENGGLLFADACCGKKAFDGSFRRFVKVLFPKHNLEQVPLDDPLFGEKLSGEKLDETSIKCRREPGGAMRNVPPFLEGIKIAERWVVLYSKYDIGCALERHKSSDCLGYNPESALKIASAAVLYTLRP